MSGYFDAFANDGIQGAFLGIIPYLSTKTSKIWIEPAGKEPASIASFRAVPGTVSACFVRCFRCTIDK
jgi:hypothetical protein